MNYFELYDIPVSFRVDEVLVKKKYLQLSRQFHPDFFINQSEDQQAAALENSTVNTRAYHTLSDFDRRMRYVLELKDMIHEGERYELPPDFLMEMMEINEGLMELKIEPDQEKISDFGFRIADLQNALYEVVKPVIENYDDKTAGEKELKRIKDYYYKKKYLLRIKGSLDSFGGS